MTKEGKERSGGKRAWRVGLAMGILLAMVTVLASGFMIETTNTDTFCVTCHLMTPFRTSWKESVHGGNNPQGFAAQCVDCHLPHGNFLQYLTTKAITGTGDVIQNMVIDPVTFDWAGNAEQNRQKFTFDSACRRCHHELTPRGIKVGGLLAHRAYLLGEVKKTCTECHPHVGHRNMIETASRFFSNM